MVRVMINGEIGLMVFKIRQMNESIKFQYLQYRLALNVVSLKPVYSPVVILSLIGSVSGMARFSGAMKKLTMEQAIAEQTQIKMKNVALA